MPGAAAPGKLPGKSVAKIQPTKLCDGAEMTIFASFLRPVFPASRVQHISDLHPKFALWPHHL